MVAHRHSVRSILHFDTCCSPSEGSVSGAAQLQLPPLDSIDASTLVRLRDRALISVMTFAFARIGAVVSMGAERP
jgi:integrase/recombinase XerD